MFETNTDLEFDDIFGSPLQLEKSGAPKRSYNNENSTFEPINKKSCVDSAMSTIPAKSMLFLKQIDEPQAEVSSRVQFKSKPSFSSSPQNILMSPLKKVVLRKFPGPAGILPDRKINQTASEEVNTNQVKQDELDICSQFTVKAFREGPWEQMRKDFNTASLFLPDKYNIAWIKTKMKNNQLVNQKAPFLAAIVQKIKCIKLKPPVVTMILKDATGQIHGTIVHDLYEEYTNVLQAGSVIILKQFGVFTAHQGSNHYLTITANNLVRIYNTESDSVKVIAVQNICVGDILKNIREVKSRHKSAVLEQKFNSGLNLNLRRISEGNLSDCSMGFGRMQTNLQRVGSNLSNNVGVFSPNKSSSVNINQRNDLILLNSSNKQRFNFKNHVNNLKESNISQACVLEANSNEILRTNMNKCEDPPVNDNNREESQSRVIKCSQISISSDNLEHTAILQNLFEGVDADLLFEDF